MVKRIDSGSWRDLDTLERLGRARDFIDHCYDHPLSLDQISEKACFSRYHFLRLFRQAFNKTPHQYLIERRIEKAKELLASTSKSIGEVARMVGIPNQFTFARTFHKIAGKNPTQYRTNATSEL
jgi:AraC-like DNA-binding protein